MYISSKELAESLNISINYLFKLCNNCGLMKKDSYSLAHLQFLLNSIELKNYKKQLLFIKLEKIVNDKKALL